MQIKNTIILSLSALLISSLTLKAQEQMNLDQCIDYAFENNLALKNNALDKNIAKENYNQAKRDLLPSLNAGGSGYYYAGRSLNENNQYVDETWMYHSYSANSSVTLFNGFQKINNIRVKKFIREQVKYDAQRAHDDLAFDIMSAYYNVVYYEEMERIGKAQVNATELELKAMTRKAELGLEAKSDLLEIKANLQEEKVNLMRMQNNHTSALMTLKQLMNFPHNNELEIINIDVKNMSPIQTEYDFNSFAQHLDNTPAVLSAKATSEQYRKQLSLSRGALSPSLNGFAHIGTYYYQTDNQSYSKQLENYLSEYVGISLSIPIFNKWSAHSNVKIAKLNYQTAQNNLEQEKQSVYYLIADEIQKTEALTKEYLEYIEQNELNKQAYYVAQKKLDKGLITIVDFYVAKNRWAESAANILNTKLQLQIKEYLLNYYKGIRFWE